MRGASAHRASLAVLSAGVLAVGCADPSPPKPPPSLADITDPCKHPDPNTCEFCQLDPGQCYPGDDAVAAQFLGMKFPGHTSHDPMGLLRCKMEAARKGNGCWLDSVIRDFSPGGFYPDEGKLKEFIQLGVEHDRVPAMVAEAAYIQDTDPSNAADLYRRAANKGHCLAQAMLAASYLDGVFTETNEAKAYFWWLWSQAPRQSTTVARLPYIAARLKDQFGYSYPGRGDILCSLSSPRLDALKTAVFAQEVRDFVLEPHPLGHPFTDELERYKDVRTVAAGEPVALPNPSGTGLVLPSGNWQKLSLSATTTLTREISRENLYNELSRSVYVVYAAPSKRAFQTRQNVAQGSGVAVKHDTVLTNCHIIRSRPEVFVVVSGHPKRAKVAAAHLEADACILRIEDTSLSPVAGVKSASAVRVGEEVLAIGSPSGLTNSLSVGVVSQHRTQGGTLYLQTTAQISPGSSGGGLFDKTGNLVGITTFKVGDAEGLNFALAVDEFVQVPPNSTSAPP